MVREDIGIMQLFCSLCGVPGLVERPTIYCRVQEVAQSPLLGPGRTAPSDTAVTGDIVLKHSRPDYIISHADITYEYKPSR